MFSNQIVDSYDELSKFARNIEIEAEIRFQMTTEKERKKKKSNNIKPLK